MLIWNTKGYLQNRKCVRISILNDFDTNYFNYISFDKTKMIILFKFSAKCYRIFELNQ